MASPTSAQSSPEDFIIYSSPTTQTQPYLPSIDSSPTYEPDSPRHGGGRLSSQYFNTAFHADFRPLTSSSRVFDGLPKQAVEDHDLPCSTTRRQLAPDPVLDLPQLVPPTTYRTTIHLQLLQLHLQLLQLHLRLK